MEREQKERTAHKTRNPFQRFLNLREGKRWYLRCEAASTKKNAAGLGYTSALDPRVTEGYQGETIPITTLMSMPGWRVEWGWHFAGQPHSSTRRLLRRRVPNKPIDVNAAGRESSFPSRRHVDHLASSERD